MGAVPTSPTKPLTATSHALLGLLAIQPWSTYELAKQVERSLQFFWPRTERKVYDEVKRLVQAGYATAREDDNGARPRTVYRITPKGRRVLAAWLGEPSAPLKLESEALVRLFFADGGELDQLRSTIAGMAEAAGEVTASKRHELTGAATDVEYRFEGRAHINAVAIEFQFRFYEMVTEWCRWADEQTAQWTSTRDPGAWEWRQAVAGRLGADGATDPTT